MFDAFQFDLLVSTLMVELLVELETCEWKCEITFYAIVLGGLHYSYRVLAYKYAKCRCARPTRPTYQRFQVTVNSTYLFAS